MPSHVPDKMWSTYLVSKLAAVPSTSIPFTAALERTRHRSIRSMREEKEDNDKNMKDVWLIMLQILSLFHISSMSSSSNRKKTGVCCILKVDWHKERELATSPGINLPPQQSVIQSELLFSLSGLSHYQKGCCFSSILSSRDMHCLAEMVQSTSSPAEFTPALAFDLFTAHSMKSTKPKKGQGNSIAVPVSYCLLSYMLLLLQFTPWQHLKCFIPHCNHTAQFFI